nr:dihydroxyacetone kinase subunit DhaL [Mycoplasmopsis cynos]
MKKLLNKTENIVEEMIQGIVKTNPNVERVPGYNVVINKHFDRSKVALISGGGSGREPAHMGYVGNGMLSGAVAGEVFTSPTPDQVEAAINALDSKAGTLLIIKNYTGDKLNFEIAQQLAQAEGKEVETVLVNDDVAVENSTWTIGRRGIAGTVYVHKIAGALAQKGGSLSEVKAVAQKVIDNVRSFGISLNSIYIPTTGKKSFELAEKEIEFGLGIHGEPGIKRENIKSSKEIVQEMIDIILKDYDYSNSEVALMINGLGGTPEMELFIVANDAHNYLAEKGIKVYTSNVGNFYDFIRNARNINFITKIRFSIKRIINGKKWGKSLKIDLKHANDIVKTIADELAKNEDFISDLDQKIGDGDHGYNIVRGFKAVLEIDSTNLSLDNYFMQIGRTLMAKVGGASGPLYGMSFMKAAAAFKNSEYIDFKNFKEFVANFAKNLQILGKVQLNEKTMYDVWNPFYTKLSEFNEINLEAKNELLEYLQYLVAQTKDMMATKGRASYLKERSIGTIDPGSFSTGIILKNFLKEL